MKKTGLLLLFAWICAGCDKAIEVPNEQQPPVAVVESIAARFAGVTDFTLTTLRTGELYAADFSSQMKHYQAIIAEDGTIRSLDLERPSTDLPETGRQYIDSQFVDPSTDYVYRRLHPLTEDLQGYLVKTTAAGQAYLLTFDPLGARISTMEAPPGAWWRSAVPNINEVPAAIRALLDAEHPMWELQDAAMFLDDNQKTTWQVAIRHSDFLFAYQFDAAANVLKTSTEDLLATDGPGTTYLDLNDVAAVPTVISDFLQVRFAGWQYQRGLLFLHDNSPAGFSVIIKVNTTIYYTRFDISGNFIGATKG